MYDGGLAKVTITMTDGNRGTVKLGKKRLLDVVTSGDEKLAVYKEKRGDEVAVRASDLMEALSRLMN